MTKAEDMYIISALHEIPILTKRIEKQKEDLTKYASSISNFTPEFGSAEAQRKEVEKLLQSTLDLIERQRWLKRCIAFTNAVSKIEIDGFTYSVTELLAIKSEARSVSYGGRRTSAETNPARPVLLRLRVPQRQQREISSRAVQQGQRQGWRLRGPLLRRG